MDDQEIFRWLDEQHDAMVAQLIDWVNINSGSRNLNGLEKMHDKLVEDLACLEADEWESLEVPSREEIDMRGEKHEAMFGRALYYKKRPEAPKQILLLGHMDTVYGEHHHFQHATHLEDGKLGGPGVTDMKGGLLIALYALRALEMSDHAKDVGWELYINPDEELGSRGSAAHLTELGDKHELALIFEPAMTTEGHIAHKRKGNGKFTFVVRGVAAHAGRSFDQGRNAIIMASHAMQAIHLLNGKREDVTLNVGLCHGGSVVNAVPDVCTFKIDVRIKRKEDEAWVFKELAKITDTLNHQEGYSLEFHGDFDRTPKVLDPCTEKWLQFVIDNGELLDQSIAFKASGGCCDGNNLAERGTLVADSMGPCGNHIHSDEEYVITQSLVDRAKLSASILMRLREFDR